MGHFQWFPMSWYWTFQEPTVLSHQSCRWASVLHQDPLLLHLLVFADNFCRGLCWFCVVRPGNTLLSYLPFSLLCSPCHLPFQDKYRAACPWGPCTVFLPAECANICSRAASEPWDVSSDTRRCSPGQGQGQRVWKQHTAPRVSGLESLGSSCLVSRATGKWGLDFRMCPHCSDVLIWSRSCFFRKFCFWSDWYLRAGRVTWIITPPLCPVQKQRISSSLRCLVCLSKRNKPLLLQLSHQGAHEAVIF